jgi:hypothetical protein
MRGRAMILSGLAVAVLLILSVAGYRGTPHTIPEAAGALDCKAVTNADLDGVIQGIKNIADVKNNESCRLGSGDGLALAEARNDNGRRGLQALAATLHDWFVDIDGDNLVAIADNRTGANFVTTHISGAQLVAAPGPVYISKVQYDSPGNDTGSNSSLNAEWVRLTNSTSSKKTVTGWTLRDASSHVYKFPSTTLAARASLRVHTGKGTNRAADKYWNVTWYVWNNTGDTATLKNTAGAIIDTCKWGRGSGSISC